MRRRVAGLHLLTIFEPNDTFTPGDESAREDQRQAWAELVERFDSSLRAFLRSRVRQDSDVDDCLQITVIKAMQFGRNVAPAARKAWLFRVAANEAAMMWRKESSKTALEKKLLEQELIKDATASADSDWSSASNDPLVDSETVARAKSLIRSLPATTQQIIDLKFRRDLTFKQISEQLEIPIGTALTQMRRALLKLRDQLSEEE